jgi:hypothetical protein
MQENKNLIFAVVGMFVLLGAVLFGKDLFIKKITKEVVEELRREYVPGPYSPGFDPDKVDPSLFVPAAK